MEKKRVRIGLLLVGAAVSMAAATAVFAQSKSNEGSSITRTRYLPEYTASGELILPKNFQRVGIRRLAVHS